MLMAHDQHRHLVTADKATRHGRYFCPGCHGAVRLKHGQVMVAHFAHQQAACQTLSEGESAEHLLGKQQLAAWFQANGYTVRLEAPLPALHQRPDILVQQGTQPPLALEFQCSPLSVTRLAERTQGYRQHGYRVLWLLGSPYHVNGRLRRHAKALKFMQATAKWGCYLVFWDVTKMRLQLIFNLLGYDGEALYHQQRYFISRNTPVKQLLHYRPCLTLPPVVKPPYQAYQRQLTLGRLGQQPVIVALQTFCYQHGGALALLPNWVYPMVAKVPLLANLFLSWYVHVFVRLRQATTKISQRELVALIQTELQPLLAPLPCLTQPKRLQQQLIDALIVELHEQQVITLQQDNWQLNATKLQWKRH